MAADLFKQGRSIHEDRRQTLAPLSHGDISGSISQLDRVRVPMIPWRHLMVFSLDRPELHPGASTLSATWLWVNQLTLQSPVCCLSCKRGCTSSVFRDCHLELTCAKSWEESWTHEASQVPIASLCSARWLNAKHLLAISSLISTTRGESQS